jgi:hemerythrin-like domain-containing protein|tara:strand:+ start:927 stop:1484 length:558 start_codon:yes stop_codon:yes gene_type:complete
MGPIDVLMYEHRLIERMLKVLTVAAEHVKVEADGETFEKSIDFIRNFADKFHHAKEENELFPLIERKGIAKEGGPIGMMLQEHDVGRNYVKGMANSLRKYKTGDKSQTNIIFRNAMDYVNLLKEHIMKEDNILYPMGNRIISDQERSFLVQRFKEIDAKAAGVGVSEKYHNLVNELEKKFNISYK